MQSNPQQTLQQPQPQQSQLSQINDSLIKIQSMSTNKVSKMSSISLQMMSDPKTKTKDTKDNSTTTLKKLQSLNFNQQLNLDMIIDRVLEMLLKCKIQLKEMLMVWVASGKMSDIVGFQAEVEKYQKTLMVRESQIGALVYIMQHRKQADFKQKYLATYSDLQKFLIQPQQALKPLNPVILQQAFETETEFLKDYSQSTKTLKQSIQSKATIEQIKKSLNRLKIINSKLATIAEVFPYACVLDKDDLFSFKKNSQRWQYLLQYYIKYKIYGDKESVKKSFVLLKNGLNVVNATMSIMDQTRGSWTGTAKDIANLAQSTGKALKCLIFKEDATHQAQLLISDPNGRLAKQIWNLPESKMLRNFIQLSLPSINFSQEFWIPRFFVEYLQQQGKIEIPKLLISDIQQYKKQLFKKREHKQGLQMRINSSYPFKFRTQTASNSQKQKNIFESFLQTFQSKPQSAPKQLIYHIHGGGFISMSSFVHQTYTRIWANNLKVPIISVDYGKAPQYPYPSGLYDCFQGYMWSLECFRQVYEVQPEKIVMVGDSAGGNLVASLTTLLLQLKLRAPDGIVLVYPALNLNYNNYTPSLLTSLNDMILPHTFLKICLKAYLRQGVDAKNMFVSPIFTSDNLLAQYPPTRIFVGSSDPFHDDCCRLTQKLNKLNKNRAKLMIFDEFPHGFLQFDMKTQPHDSCRKATKQVENALAELLEL